MEPGLSVNNLVILKLKNDGFNRLALLYAVCKTVSFHRARHQNRKGVTAVIDGSIALNHDALLRQNDDVLRVIKHICVNAHRAQRSWASSATVPEKNAAHTSNRAKTMIKGQNHVTAADCFDRSPAKRGGNRGANKNSSRFN